MSRHVLADEDATLAFGAQLATGLETPLVVFLQGPIGAGKTTFVRGLLQALGHAGAVRSPTYTLYESYDLVVKSHHLACIHCDLYRLRDPGELQFIGLAELLRSDTCMLIEWPEIAVGELPQPDLVLQFAYAGAGRIVDLSAPSAAGGRVTASLDNPVNLK